MFSKGSNVIVAAFCNLIKVTNIFTNKQEVIKCRKNLKS